ncbi:unnamed protein product [Protopolystoma xenopodis]|uniref:Uncharacterized protein n=1 Tax=Protopolystoma xenopodis TaxID=117903 RepID=A0A448XJE6_9PLAT|nr:unnamed protein product [Protopolystoma xenopodis]
MPPTCQLDVASLVQFYRFHSSLASMIFILALVYCLVARHLDFFSKLPTTLYTAATSAADVVNAVAVAVAIAVAVAVTVKKSFFSAFTFGGAQQSKRDYSAFRSLSAYMATGVSMLPEVTGAKAEPPA